jgi:hypothetical protein
MEFELWVVLVEARRLKVLYVKSGLLGGLTSF